MFSCVVGMEVVARARMFRVEVEVCGALTSGALGAGVDGLTSDGAAVDLIANP